MTSFQNIKGIPIEKHQHFLAQSLRYLKAQACSNRQFLSTKVGITIKIINVFGKQQTEVCKQQKQQQPSSTFLDQNQTRFEPHRFLDTRAVMFANFAGRFCHLRCRLPFFPFSRLHALRQFD